MNPAAIKSPSERIESTTSHSCILAAKYYVNIVGLGQIGRTDPECVVEKSLLKNEASHDKFNVYDEFRFLSACRKC